MLWALASQPSRRPSCTARITALSKRFTVTIFAGIQIDLRHSYVRSIQRRVVNHNSRPLHCGEHQLLHHQQWADRDLQPGHYNRTVKRNGSLSTFPPPTTGTMTVTVQSSNLSSLAPLLQVYNSSGSLLGQISAPNTFGATISLSMSVSSGQGYYIKATDAGGAAPVSNYGLLVNFGSQTRSPISPPDTVVPQEPDSGGGGTISNVVVAGAGSTSLGSSTGGLGTGQANLTAIGTLSG